MAEGSLIDVDFLAFLAREHAEATKDSEAHRAQCKEDPCVACERFRCPSCAARVAAKGHCGPCEVLRHRDRLLSSVDIPRGFLDCELSGQRARKVLSPAMIARGLASLQTTRIVFTGLPGSGKTTLMTGMLIARVASAHPRWKGFWVSSHDLASARANAPLGSEPEIIKRAVQADLLCLDELAGESDRYGSALGEIIYTRHKEARQTWITTGSSATAISQRYNGGVGRRVFEDVPDVPNQHDVRIDMVRGR